jgi:hypothetical protein
MQMSLRVRVLSAVAAGAMLAGLTLVACSKAAPPAPIVPIANTPGKAATVNAAGADAVISNVAELLAQIV